MESPERERQIIVDYMASQAGDETVEHLEKVASERILGRRHDIWDVHTDVERWWVITNPTNFYSQKQFPSMDVALTFHIGLMARVIERSKYAVSDEEIQRFAGSWRRWQQAAEAFNEADEAEEFQSVGMRCRESLIAFVREAAGVVTIPEGATSPQMGNFLNWSDLIANAVAGGASAERRRGYLKSVAKSTWELVQWLTHATNATRFDAQFTLDATEHVLSAFSISLIRFERGIPDRCPQCMSYRLEFDYGHDDAGTMLQLTICTVCGWEGVVTVVSDEGQIHNGVENETSKPAEDLGPCVFVEVPLRGPNPPEPSLRKQRK